MASSVESKAELRDEDHELVMQQFEEYVDASLTSRANAEKCRRYRDGEQWTEADKQVLKRRKQPIITDNKIQDKCDTLLGIEKQQRSDPRAFPRNPEDEDSAEAATDALRYIADSSDFNLTVRKPAADNLIVEGLCAGQVIIDPKRKVGNVPKVVMEHIRWDRLYYDVHSLKDDFSDKTYAGLFTWMDEEQAKRLFNPKTNKQADPEAWEHLDSSWSQESASGPDSTHDDKPRYILTTRGRKRVQVFETYFLKDGVWMFGKWCKGGWLEKVRKSPYKNEDGEPDCAIELQALYRDADGNPYGAVPRYLDLQDEHNKRRSKMLHLLNAKRVILEKGTVDDIAALRAEIHKPDGVIEVGGDTAKFRIEDNLAEAEGQWRLMQQTEMALSQTGPNAALQGQSGDLSGRAKQLDQNAGTLPISPLFDALDSWELRMYRQAWCRVRQFWTAETWVRVTDDEQKLRFVPLNQPMMQGDYMAQQLKRQRIPEEQKIAMVQEIAADPNAMAPMIDPETGRQRMRNAVSEMDVDIIIDRSMDVVNIQQEQFAGLLEIAKVRPEVPFDVLLEASSLRSDTKRRVLEKLGKAQQIPPELQQQVQQQQEALQQAAQQLQAKEEELKALEQSIKDESANVKVDAAQLDVKRAEIREAEANLKTLEAQLNAKRTEVSMAEKQISQTAQIEQERLNAGVETARAKLGQEAAARSEQTMQKAQETTGGVVEQVAKMLEQQSRAVEKALEKQSAKIIEMTKPRQRKIAIERGPDGKAASLSEELE